MPVLQKETNYPDALRRPVFGFSNKLARLAWQIAYLLLFRVTPTTSHRWRCWVLRAFGAKLGRNNFIYPSVRIWAPWLLETGDVVTIARGVELYNPGGIHLAHHTVVSQDAYLCGATHDYNSPNFDYVMKPIRTEPYTWICAKALVLAGVVCKTGSVLGAGAVASRDLEPFTVYAGNPAKPVTKRNPNAAPTAP